MVSWVDLSEGCRVSDLGNLHPLDQSPAPEDDGPVLGLFVAVGGGQTHRDQQVQHLPAAVVGRGGDGDAGPAGRVGGGVASGRRVRDLSVCGRGHDGVEWSELCVFEGCV
jgi:hypothetical protein